MSETAAPDPRCERLDRIVAFLGDHHEALAMAVLLLSEHAYADVTFTIREPHGQRELLVRTQLSRVVPAGNGGRRKPRRTLLRLCEVPTFAGGPGSCIWRAR